MSAVWQVYTYNICTSTQMTLPYMTLPNQLCRSTSFRPCMVSSPLRGLWDCMPITSGQWTMMLLDSSAFQLHQRFSSIGLAFAFLEFTGGPSMEAEFEWSQSFTTEVSSVMELRLALRPSEFELTLLVNAIFSIDLRTARGTSSSIPESVHSPWVRWRKKPGDRGKIESRRGTGTRY